LRGPLRWFCLDFDELDKGYMGGYSIIIHFNWAWYKNQLFKQILIWLIRTIPPPIWMLFQTIYMPVLLLFGINLYVIYKTHFNVKLIVKMNFSIPILV